MNTVLEQFIAPLIPWLLFLFAMSALGTLLMVFERKIKGCLGERAVTQRLTDELDSAIYTCLSDVMLPVAGGDGRD